MTTIAVYGANGFQGKLVSAELARRGLDTVLVGRSAQRLRDAAHRAGLAVAQIRSAAIEDHRALVSAFNGADTVVNCAGPFTATSDHVVRAAIAAGCHYVDTCGEPPQIHHLHQTLDTSARTAGVAVVPATTDGAVPGDLLAHLLWQRLGPLASIRAAHRITVGQMSRGSIRSLLELSASPERFVFYRDGTWRFGDDRPARVASFEFPGESEPTDVVGFPLQEVVLVPRHIQVREVETLLELSLAARLTDPIPPAAVETAPEGPDEAQRAAQRWTIVVDALGENGGKARGFAHGPDTYGTTAVIAVEAALRLANSDTPRGVLAPAQAFDSTRFLDALAPYGISWQIE